MRTQQPHVKVTSPAKAHRVKTSTMAKHGGRLRMESARLSIPYRGTHEREVLEKETPHPTPDISTSVTSPMIWSLYALRKGAINPRHAWHADPTADGPPPRCRGGPIKTKRHHTRGSTYFCRKSHAEFASMPTSGKDCAAAASTGGKRPNAANANPTTF